MAGNTGMTPCLPTCDVALITQMRAGTHYMCAGLRMALEATIYRPDSERQFVVMDDDYIRKGLHNAENIELPVARPERIIHFCHYYHPQTRLLVGKPHIYLIGFPFDSFFSDAVVASQGSNDPAPSGPRSVSYVLRFGGSEWCALERKMRENAAWLMNIAESDNALIVRYEDLSANFDDCAQRLESFVGKFINPLPKPTKNARRTYWTKNYSAAFDQDALQALWKLFSSSIERFYPERLASLKDTL